MTDTEGGKEERKWRIRQHIKTILRERERESEKDIERKTTGRQLVCGRGDEGENAKGREERKGRAFILR